MFYIFLIALIILVFPIPLKIKLVLNNNELKIFIYKKEIKTATKLDFNKTLDKLRNKEAETHHNDNEQKIKNKQQKNKASAKVFFHICLNRLFKPTLKIDFNINLGFNDASASAMAYGFINSIPGFIYNILCKFFKIKKFKFNAQPIFNNEIVYIKISSIIFVNLVKVIYISLKFALLYFKEKKFMRKEKVKNKINKKAKVKFGGGI